MQIMANEATLNTCSVTIRALTVSGKQVTLALFRQLPTVEACNDNGPRRGLRFWGLVRYQIKDEGFLWAIAEHDGMLVRCCLDFDVRYARQRAAEANRKWADTLAESRRQLEEARTQAWRTEASIAHLQKMRDKEDADAASVFRYHRDRLPLADAFEELQALPQLFIAT